VDTFHTPKLVAYWWFILLVVKTPYLTLFDQYTCLQDFLEKTHNPYQQDVGSPETTT
jgi:hypothetical protein